MNCSADNQVTQLLRSARDGDETARRALVDVVYDDLRRIAHRLRGVGKFGDTLQATALVNMAFLSWEDKTRLPIPSDLADRSAFYKACALAMRQLIRDHLRKSRAIKRGGGAPQVSLQHYHEHATPAGTLSPAQHLDLDLALERLKKRNPRW